MPSWRKGGRQCYSCGVIARATVLSKHVSKHIVIIQLLLNLIYFDQRVNLNGHSLIRSNIVDTSQFYLPFNLCSNGAAFAFFLILAHSSFLGTTDICCYTLWPNWGDCTVPYSEAEHEALWCNHPLMWEKRWGSHGISFRRSDRFESSSHIVGCPVACCQSLDMVYSWRPWRSLATLCDDASQLANNSSVVLLTVLFSLEKHIGL